MTQIFSKQPSKLIPHLISSACMQLFTFAHEKTLSINLKNLDNLND